MKYAVYSDPNGGSLLLVNDDLWVINGEWQIEKKDGLFYCLAPDGARLIDIHLAGYVDWDGRDYNDALNRFRDGEGTHILYGVAEPVVADLEPELCKRKYYGIDCSCSKCRR